MGEQRTLINVLLGVILADGGDTRLLGPGWVGGVRVVDGVLEELVGVLLYDHHSHSLENISEVFDQDSSFRRELLEINGSSVDGVFEDLVDLRVVRHSSACQHTSYQRRMDLPCVESFNDTPKLHLPGDIGLQLLSRSGGSNTHLPGVVGNLGCRCWCRHVADMSAGMIGS